MDRQVNISITAGTIIKAIFILALTWALWKTSWLVLDVLVAIVIASAIEPGVVKLMRLRFPRVLAVITLYMLLFATVFIIFFFFLPSVLTDLAVFVQQLPTFLGALTHVGAFDQYAQILGVSTPAQFSASAILEGLEGGLNISGTFTNAFSAIAVVFGGFFSFIIIIVFSFYFAVLETGVDDFLRVIVPKKRQRYVLGLWKRSQHKIGLWMQGQLLLGVIMGVMVFLGLTILGIPHALVLAVIAGVFEIIPVFGPTLSAVPAVIIGFVNGGIVMGTLVSGPVMGLIVIGLYVIFQQFENHLIYPLVVTRVVGVPPLLVILALIVGGELAGFLGIILAVPLAGTLQELARDIESGHLFADDSAETHHA